VESLIEILQANPRETAANIVSILAVICMFISYQVKSPRRLLIVQGIATLCSAIGFGILGAWTGMTMNIIGIFRNYIYCNRDKKIFAHKSVPYIIAAVMVVFGLLSWTNWYSVLSIAGIAINAVCLASPSAQLIRKSCLVTGPMAFAYSLLSHNYVEALKEVIGITSAGIGILRYKKEKQ